MHYMMTTPERQQLEHSKHAQQVRMRALPSAVRLMGIFTAVSMACSVMLTVWVLRLAFNEEYLMVHSSHSVTVTMTAIVVPTMLLMWLVPASRLWNLKEGVDRLRHDDQKVGYCILGSVALRRP
jgi:heme/copper-type cytochrome/quinol oxidase subunit 2